MHAVADESNGRANQSGKSGDYGSGGESDCLTLQLSDKRKTSINIVIATNVMPPI